MRRRVPSCCWWPVCHVLLPIVIEAASPAASLRALRLQHSGNGSELTEQPATSPELRGARAEVRRVSAVQVAGGAAEARGWAGQASGQPTNSTALHQVLQAGVGQALQDLRAAADAATIQRIADTKSVGRVALDGHISAALQEQRAILERMAPGMEADLEQVRLALASAKSGRAKQAGEAATMAAKEVQDVGMQKFAALRQVGDSLAGEAQAMLADISAANASIADSERQARSSSGTGVNGAASVEQALLGQNQTARQLQEQAEAAERTAGLVDAEAAQVLGTLAEASRRAANASEIALQAVQQATQNALKLKTVRTLVDQTAQVATNAATAAATASTGLATGR